MHFNCVLEMFQYACCILWFKQYIDDACRNKEHQPLNNMYYETQAWKYNDI
jgi:hypothetical protein